jgi:subtilisin family serine protease
MSRESVELFGEGGAERCGSLLAELRDPQTGKWLRVERPPEAPPDLTGRGTVVAVVDTGLAAEHPLIASRLDDQVDLTGDGIGDRCGHGTVVALILLAYAPDCRLVDVKAFDDRGGGDPARLIEAFQWIARRGGIDTVNLSAGVYRAWCQGDCDICRAARGLTDQGVGVVVAAGHRPGVSACPAKAVGVLVVAEVDPITCTLTDQSGIAGEEGFVAKRRRWLLRPVDGEPAH